MKKIFFALLFFFPVMMFAQNVGIGITTPHPNAMLDITGINKGLLIPRGDAATRTTLSTNTAKGLLVYDTVSNIFWAHNGNGLASGWQSLSAGDNYWMLNGALGTEIKNSNTGGFWSAASSTLSSDTGVVQTPVNGAGTRLMWIAPKSAFRVGTVWTSNWDADNIGSFSFAAGKDTKAKGFLSTAFGELTTASGVASTAWGLLTTASGLYSSSMGFGTVASGSMSASTGFYTNSRALSSFAIGRYNDSVAISDKNAWVKTDPLFYIGNGTGNTDRHNAMVVYKNGDMVLKNPSILYIRPTAYSVPVSGAGTRLMWLPEISAFRVGSVEGTEWDADSIGNSSFAAGFNTKATGMYSTAMGVQTKATDWGATALGRNTIASKEGATAMGAFNTASGYYSTAMGVNVVASGDGGSVATGDATLAQSVSSFAIGRYNDGIAGSNTSTWVNTDPLFYIGNGTSIANRHNAMVVYKNGNLILKNPTTVTSDPVGFTLPVSGAGTRMMWLPEKGAFRAGIVIGNRWDADSIGLGSFAVGMNSKAKGIGSVAMGEGALANQHYSTAMGFLTRASGVYSTAFGELNIALGVSSTVMGSNNGAIGNYSTSMGNITSAIGEYSTSMGRSTNAYGESSTAMGNYTSAYGLSSTSTGQGNRAIGDFSLVAGVNTIATGTAVTALGVGTAGKSYASLVAGQYNDSITSSNSNSWVASDPLIILGNGTSNISRSNALVVYKNGNTDISGYTQLGTTTEGAPSIKMKKLTVNTPAAQGAFNFVAHGITQSKILSISALATIPGGFQILPNHEQAGFKYTLNVDNGNIAVGTVPGNSASILNAPVKIVVVYEE